MVSFNDPFIAPLGGVVLAALAGWLSGWWNRRRERAGTEANQSVSYNLGLLAAQKDFAASLAAERAALLSRLADLDKQVIVLHKMHEQCQDRIAQLESQAAVRERDYQRVIDELIALRNQFDGMGNGG